MLTALELMFVREFCRQVGAADDSLETIKVTERDVTVAGFMTQLDPRTVPKQLIFEEGVFAPLRIAIIGREQFPCGMVLYFDKKTRVLAAIEGHPLADGDWPIEQELAYWSESDRISTDSEPDFR